MVHVRHACNDTIWVLVYVFNNRGLSQTADSSGNKGAQMWIRFDATNFDSAGGGPSGGVKAVQYFGDQTNGQCSSTDGVNCLGTEPAICTSAKCGICCNDMW
jgi:hypothetical protein